MPGKLFLYKSICYRNTPSFIIGLHQACGAYRPPLAAGYVPVNAQHSIGKSKLLPSTGRACSQMPHVCLSAGLDSDSGQSITGGRPEGREPPQPSH